MNNKWRAAQAACVLLDLGCLAGLARKKWKGAAILLSLHGLEWVLFGHRVGKLSEMKTGESLLKTLALGSTWWLPQNEITHEKLEAQVDKDRFRTKASGVKLVRK